MGTQWRRGIPVGRKAVWCGDGAHTILAKGESTQLQLQAPLPPAQREYQEWLPTDHWLYMYHIHSTELAKAGEKDVQLKTPILQKGDGVPDVSKTLNSGVHSSQGADSPFLTLNSTGNFSISTSILGCLLQCGLSVPAGRRKQLFCSGLRLLTPSLAAEQPLLAQPLPPAAAA